MLFVIHGYPPSLDRLKKGRPDDFLFRMQDATFTSAIGEAGEWDGAYIVKDREKGQLRRAGTATNGLREGWMQHERADYRSTSELCLLWDLSTRGQHVQPPESEGDISRLGTVGAPGL
mmetsp:Transcript_23652/g.35013  ORF Transcript_23652/g.35013 Transcript_23652/m.35013 type:complete len:118 (-) Transcript_23652:298-651(-)